MPVTQNQITPFLRRQPHVKDWMAADNYQYALTTQILRWEGEEPDTPFCWVGLDYEIDHLQASVAEHTIGSNFYDGTYLYVAALDVDGGSHENGHSPETIAKLAEALKEIPYVYLIRSKSGTGLHIYILLAEPVRTSRPNATVAAVREILGRDLGIDLKAGPKPLVDCGGQQMFFYSPTPGPNGFEVLSEPTEVFTEQIPEYFPESSRRPRIDQDDSQDRLIQWLSTNANCDFQIVKDGLYALHTSDIARAHKELGLKGEFVTSARGGNNKPNCYMFPLENSKWFVGRWNASEPRGWATVNSCDFCILNEGIRLDIFAKLRSLKSQKGGFYLDAPNTQALADARQITVPQGTECLAREHRGQLTLTSDAAVEGWSKLNRTTWGLTIGKEEAGPDPSKIIRVAIRRGEKGQRYYAHYKLAGGDCWNEVDHNLAVERLCARGLKEEALTHLAPDTPFDLVTVPFAGEFPGPGLWNTCQTQFVVQPRAGEHPTYDLIFDHIGKGLDAAVKADKWCCENGVTTGAQYLRLWAAIMYRHPEHRTPGLGLESPGQNNGKSTFAMSLRLPMTAAGYCSSARGITTNFNGQLEGVVLLDLDDVDLSEGNGRAYHKMLSDMTNDTFACEAKGKQERQVTNYLHYIHSANQLEKFVVQPGDTRWVIIPVGSIAPGTEIPKHELQKRLCRERAAFLHTLFSLELPPQAGRLWLPVLETEAKRELMQKRAVCNFDDRLKTLCQKMITAANDGQLSDYRTIGELSEVLSLRLDPQQFPKDWPRIEPYLKALGHATDRRSNTGHTKAGYLISPGSQA